MNKTGGECIAIVAYDAGAASHIFSWLKTGLLKIDQCRFCLDGPAAKLFKIIQPQIKIFCYIYFFKIPELHLFELNPEIYNLNLESL